jgi:hypothetical protein
VSEEIVKGALEVDGETWTVWRQRQPDGRTFVSFDGESFHAKGADAYVAAKKAGRLQRADAPEAEGLPEDAAAAMVELVRLIATLRPGEELRVIHSGASLNVVKNRLVAAFSPSVFAEVENKGGDEEEG